MSRHSVCPRQLEVAQRELACEGLEQGCQLSLVRKVFPGAAIVGLAALTGVVIGWYRCCPAWVPSRIRERSNSAAPRTCNRKRDAGFCRFR